MHFSIVPLVFRTVLERQISAQQSVTDTWTTSSNGVIQFRFVLGQNVRSIRLKLPVKQAALYLETHGLFLKLGCGQMMIKLRIYPRIFTVAISFGIFSRWIENLRMLLNYMNNIIFFKMKFVESIIKIWRH